MILILSCEHGGNEIPKEYKSLFKGKEKLLKTHRGFDPGTLDLFEELQVIAHYSKGNVVSRLLVECNRSLHHPNLFSEFTKPLDKISKYSILENYYFPYRNSIEDAIADAISNGETVLHLSLHSFTPELNEKIRSCEIGLLYDSKRLKESNLCKKLRKMLLETDPSLRIRLNYPYLGRADGFTSYLRKKFQNNYLGIEFEVNQKQLTNEKFPAGLKTQLKQILKKLTR